MKLYWCNGISGDITMVIFVSFFLAWQHVHVVWQPMLCCDAFYKLQTCVSAMANLSEIRQDWKFSTDVSLSEMSVKNFQSWQMQWRVEWQHEGIMVFPKA